MIRTQRATFAVISTAILSSFIHYDNPIGMAFKLTQFQMLAGIIGVGLLLLLKESPQRDDNAGTLQERGR